MEYREGNRIPRDDGGERDGYQKGGSRKNGVVVVTSLGTSSLLLSNAVGGLPCET